MGALPNTPDRDSLREAARGTLRALYSASKKHWPGFEKRQGQLQMMARVLDTLLDYKEPGSVRDGQNLCLVEGKTGSGKTVGYLLPALAVAQVTGKQVVVSTATVALQEQLAGRDVPRLAAVAKVVGIDLTFALLKGRQRYFCRAKAQHTGDDGGHAEHAVRLVGRLRDTFDRKRWSGDRDDWPDVIEDPVWSSVEADRGSCTTRKCAYYTQCSFYRARAGAKDARIVVANHAMVLSALTSDGGLVRPDDTLFVFDEGHHLPEIARNHFAQQLSLRGVAVTADRLIPAIAKAGKATADDSAGRSAADAGEKLRRAKALLSQLRQDLLEDEDLSRSETKRFAHGKLPDGLAQTMQTIGHLLSGAVKQGAAVASMLRDRMDQVPPHVANGYQRMLGEIGPGLLKLDSAVKLVEMWGHSGKVPKAKWLSLHAKEGADPEISLHASALTGAADLAATIWQRVAAAAITSATLTSCGTFEYFTKLSGLARYPMRFELQTESPFRYDEQGELRVARMRSDPKNVEAFGVEFRCELARRLQHGTAGQLVLFHTGRQMRATYEAMPADVKRRILMQGEMPRRALLIEHGRRIEAGEPSTIFGLQSFGEGIDLPGKLCEAVHIEKIPFAPDGPVDEALAEWLKAQGRNAFEEISIPRAAMTLSQWSGRGIRTITDWASITMYDRRIVDKRYGAELLRSMPPLPFINENVAG